MLCGRVLVLRKLSSTVLIHEQIQTKNPEADIKPKYYVSFLMTTIYVNKLERC